MKPGPRTHQSATLRITYSALLPANLRGRLREVSHFVATNPGRGHGTELLRQVCQEADADRIVLMLQPVDVRSGALYVRHGFRLIQEYPPLMMRSPVWVTTPKTEARKAALTMESK